MCFGQHFFAGLAFPQPRQILLSSRCHGDGDFSMNKMKLLFPPMPRATRTLSPTPIHLRGPSLSQLRKKSRLPNVKKAASHGGAAAARKESGNVNLRVQHQHRERGMNSISPLLNGSASSLNGRFPSACCCWTSKVSGCCSSSRIPVRVAEHRRFSAGWPSRTPDASRFLCPVCP